MQSLPSTSGRVSCSRQLTGRATQRSVMARAAAVAAPPKTLQFAKYQGLGNDFILVRAGRQGPYLTTGRGPLTRVHLAFLLPFHIWPTQVDNRHAIEPVITPEQAVAICNRNFGIGGDGVRRAGASNCARILASRPPVHGTQIQSSLSLLTGVIPCRDRGTEGRGACLRCTHRSSLRCQQSARPT